MESLLTQKKIVSILLTSSVFLIFSSFFSNSIASAADQTINEPTFATSELELLDLDDSQLVAVLELIEEMPEEVILAGEASMANWISQNYSAGEIQTMGFGSVAACVGAVGTAIVVNFTPAKIVKIRSALKAVGGAKTFVTNVRPYYNMARADGGSKKSSLNLAVKEAAKDAGPDTREALLDLFGVSAVVGACAS